MKFNKRIFRKEIAEFYGQTLRRQINSEFLNNIETLLFFTELDNEWKYPSELAYFFATIGWETAWTFAPIVEKRASSNQSDIRRMQDRYWNTGYYGRGYVQLTWKENYKKLGDVIEVDLVNKPDELLKPSVSYEVASIGMRKGLFRSRNNGSPIKLSDFVNATNTDFIKARDVINGDVDKNGLFIARFAAELLDIFKASIIEAIVDSGKDDIPELPYTTVNADTTVTVTNSNSSQPTIPTTSTNTIPSTSVSTGTAPWTPPIKIDPSTPTPTGGPKSLVTVISTAVSSLGLTGSAIWGYVAGVIPNINPTFLFIACLVCIAVTASVYIASRIYIKNARENRAALLDMQRVEITADPTKINVECQLNTK